MREIVNVFKRSIDCKMKRRESTIVRERERKRERKRERNGGPSQGFKIQFLDHCNYFYSLTYGAEFPQVSTTTLISPFEKGECNNHIASKELVLHSKAK